MEGALSKLGGEANIDKVCIIIHYGPYNGHNILTKSVLDGLDRVSRSFLWRSTPEKRKKHLVAWDRVCLPRREGGLGIRASKDMNKAFLGKVGVAVIS